MYNGQDHREMAQKYERTYNDWYDGGIVRFSPNFDRNQVPNSANDGYNSGEASPPLWRNSPSRPLLRRRSLSPESRTEAIARGRSELMEMVRNMPEASYELTLKDLVEHCRVESLPPPLPTAETRVSEGENVGLQRRVNMRRNESFENRGVVLNMVFPFPLKSKKKRNFDTNSCGKVSPRPEMGLKGGGGGGGERDWWKKKFTGSSDSDGSGLSGSSGGGSSGSSGSSGGSGRSHGGGKKREGLKGGCCVFFKPRRGKSVE